MDYFYLAGEILLWSLVPAATLILIMAHRDPPGWAIPLMWVTLAFCLAITLRGGYYALMLFVFSYMVQLARAISVWDEEAKRESRNINSLPSWLRDTPDRGTRVLKELDRQVPPLKRQRGFHRPQSVRRRTGEFPQITKAS